MVLLGNWLVLGLCGYGLVVCVWWLLCKLATMGKCPVALCFTQCDTRFPHMSYTILSCILPYLGLDATWDACMGVLVQDVFCTVTISLGEQCTLVNLFTIAVSFNSCCRGFSPGAVTVICT